jgi:hypothetical protein
MSWERWPRGELPQRPAYAAFQAALEKAVAELSPEELLEVIGEVLARTTPSTHV